MIIDNFSFLFGTGPKKLTIHNMIIGIDSQNRLRTHNMLYFCQVQKEHYVSLIGFSYRKNKET